MKLTDKELKKLRTINGMVLVKPSRRNDEIEVGGKKLYLDTSYEEAEHANVYGIVIKIPQNLRHHVMGWKTNVELKTGDEVWYSQQESCQVMDKPERQVEVNNEQYLLIDYGQCFCAKREGKIIMLNGYLLIEPIEEEVKSSIVVPEMSRRRKTKMGYVKFLGSKNESYLVGKKWENKDVLNIEEGQKVMFRRFADIPLESDLHKKLDNKYWRIQRKHIECIVDPIEKYLKNNLIRKN